MKKIISIFGAIIIAYFILTGCGNNPTDKTTNSESINMSEDGTYCFWARDDYSGSDVTVHLTINDSKINGVYNCSRAADDINGCYGDVQLEGSRMGDTLYLTASYKGASSGKMEKEETKWTLKNSLVLRKSSKVYSNTFLKNVFKKVNCK